MDKNSILVFTRNGLGEGPQELQHTLVKKFLALLNENDTLPAKLLFYTEGVKLACEGSPVIESLKKLEEKKVELILCSTCLDFYGLTDKVQVGIVGSMADMIEGMQKATKVINV